MNGEFRWMPQRSMYILNIVDTRGGGQGVTHHFEADPKIAHSEDIWMELLKLVADFLQERGTDVSAVQKKLAQKHASDIFTSEPYDEIQQEQDRAAGGADDGSGHVSASPGGEPTAGGTVPAGGATSSVEPDSTGPTATHPWPTSPPPDRPGSAGADASEAAGGGTPAVGEPD